MGIFDIACAELCGPNHFTMASQLVVEPRVAYEAWLQEQVGDDPKSGIWARWRD
jgi:heme/copper-type cytochrome/quinol oxidase subunit 2